MPYTGTYVRNPVNNCSCGHAQGNHNAAASTCSLCLQANPGDTHVFGPPAAFSGSFESGGQTPQTLSVTP